MPFFGPLRSLGPSAAEDFTVQVQNLIRDTECPPGPQIAAASGYLYAPCTPGASVMTNIMVGIPHLATGIIYLKIMLVTTFGLDIIPRALRSRADSCRSADTGCPSGCPSCAKRSMNKRTAHSVSHAYTDSCTCFR